ncbi:MAG: glycyl-radical enzyme activating protein [Desulfobacterales bacterium]|nr:glycyl-radical enzyme activating protein [Desulfobacterales bacterium]
MKYNKNLIFNIQKFSIYDGPGIRTTIFYKGCPLSCSWCHNPESKKSVPEILTKDQNCKGCGSCLNSCPVNKLYINNGRVCSVKDIECKGCGKCADCCINSARELAGKEYNLNDLVGLIESDQIFYDESGGGVTFSGGEPLLQIDSLEKLAHKCKMHGIHVAVDTSGQVPFEYFERIIPHADLFLYDIKIMDLKSHKLHTGVSNNLIIENLKKLSLNKAKVWLRLPVIDDLNNNDKHIDSVLKLLCSINIDQINILPYHDMAIGKATITDRVEKFKTPSDHFINHMQKRFQDNGYKTIIGG